MLFFHSSRGQEEIAYYWTSVKGTPYEVKDGDTCEHGQVLVEQITRQFLLLLAVCQDIFIKNFWKTFKEYLPKNSPIKDFKKCDFTKLKLGAAELADVSSWNLVQFCSESMGVCIHRHILSCVTCLQIHAALFICVCETPLKCMSVQGPQVQTRRLMLPLAKEQPS